MILSLPALSSPAIYSFGNVTINVSLVSSSPIEHYSPASDQCGKLIASDICLYHISKERIYQNWHKGSLSTVIYKQDFGTGTDVFKDAGVNEAENRVNILTNNTFNGRIVYYLNPSYQYIQQFDYSQTIAAEQIATNGL